MVLPAIPISAQSAMVAPAISSIPGTLQVAQGKFLKVLAVVNLTRQIGKIEHVQPLEIAQIKRVAADSHTRLRIRDSNNAVLHEEPVELRLGSCPMPDEDRSGLIDAILPNDPEARFVDLLLDGRVLDTYSGASVQPTIANIRHDDPRSPERFH